MRCAVQRLRTEHRPRVPYRCGRAAKGEWRDEWAEVYASRTVRLSVVGADEGACPAVRTVGCRPGQELRLRQHLSARSWPLGEAPAGKKVDRWPLPPRALGQRDKVWIGRGAWGSSRESDADILNRDRKSVV